MYFSIDIYLKIKKEKYIYVKIFFLLFFVLVVKKSNASSTHANSGMEERNDERRNSIFDELFERMMDRKTYSLLLALGKRKHVKPDSCSHLQRIYVVLCFSENDAIETHTQ